MRVHWGVTAALSSRRASDKGDFMSRSRSCTRSAGITRFVRLQKTPFFRREVRPSAAMRLRGGIVKIDMHRGSTTREDSQIAFINEQVLAQSHEDCSFCPRGCGASRRRTATCSSSRMSSRGTTLRTLRAALGLCVGARGISAAGSPESARAATALRGSHNQTPHPCGKGGGHEKRA